MKVDNIQTNPVIVKTEPVKVEKEPVDKVDKTQVKEQPAAVFEKSEPNKAGHVYDKNTIMKLKRDSEQAHASLIRIVQDMLKRQGKTLDMLDGKDTFEVDETARMEAQALIGPDGELGAEAVSQRLVDFAIALSGGDKSKADILRGAIEKGFKEAEKILGELPGISKDTYKLTMEKFDAWAKGED